MKDKKNKIIYIILLLLLLISSVFMVCVLHSNDINSDTIKSDNSIRSVELKYVNAYNIGWNSYEI